MAASVDEDVSSCHCPDRDFFADLNEVQADRIIVDTKLVQIEHSYTSIHKKCHVTMMTAQMLWHLAL